MNVDNLNLNTKKRVYMSAHPLTFQIYEGMCESVYLLNNSIAFSSVCTLGMYTTLRKFFEAIPVDFSEKLVVDDILGMIVDGQLNGQVSKKVNWTNSYIRQLMSLNRIAWKCPHEDWHPLKHVNEFIRNAKCVLNATPLHYMHVNRLDSMGSAAINEKPDTWFIIPAGTVHSRMFASTWGRIGLKRPHMILSIPAPLVDCNWLVIPPLGVTDYPVVPGAHLLPPDETFPAPQVGMMPYEQERDTFLSLYG